MKKQPKQTSPEILLEAQSLRAKFREKGVTHLWDFIQPFHPKTKFDQDEFRLCIYGRKANAEVVKVLRDVLKRIK